MGVKGCFGERFQFALHLTKIVAFCSHLEFASWVEGAEVLVGFHQPVWGDRMGRSDWGLSLSLASVLEFPITATLDGAAVALESRMERRAASDS